MREAILITFSLNQMTLVWQPEEPLFLGGPYLSEVKFFRYELFSGSNEKMVLRKHNAVTTKIGKKVLLKL